MRRPPLLVAAVVLSCSALGLPHVAGASADPPAARPADAVHTSTGRTAARHTGRARYVARFVDVSGHPLAGVVASLYDADSTSDYEHAKTTTSGPDGRVSLTVPAGEYVVGADGDDATGGSSDATGYVGRESIQTLHAGRTLDAGTIALRPGGVVRIHVVDDQGHPVRGVRPALAPTEPYVVAEGDENASFDGTYALAEAPRTDTAGNTFVRGMPHDYPYRVCLNDIVGDTDGRAGGGIVAYRAGCTMNSQLARAGRTVRAPTLTVHRSPGAALTGVLRGAGAAGFAQSEVEVDRGGNAVAYATTDTAGRFVIAGLAPGTYRVCSADGAYSYLGRTGYLPGCANRSVTVTAQLSAKSSTIVLRRAAAASGTITDRHGTPAPGVDVQFNHSGFFLDDTQTDAHGRFVAKGLPPGRNGYCVYTFNETASRALPTGLQNNCQHAHQHLVLHAGTVRTGLSARLRTAAAVAGVARDRAGHPVPYATVELEDADEDLGYADRHGRFSIVGVPAGRYRLCAGLTDEPDIVGVVGGCRHRPVSLSVGRTVRVGVRIPTTSEIDVRVTDAASRSVAGVDAAAIDACRSDCTAGTPLLTTRKTVARASAVTDGHGTVVLDGLRAGYYAVCLFAFYGTTRYAHTPATGYQDRCTATTFTLRVVAGRVTRLHETLQPAGAVSGTVTDSAGAPLAGVLVHVAGSAADDVPSGNGDPFVSEDGGAAAPPGYYSRTAADGTFRVRSVRPGERLVCLDPRDATGGSSTKGYVPQCFGGTPQQPEQGSPVSVPAGATTGGIDVALTSGAGISGHVSSSITGAQFDVVLFDAGNYVTQKQPDRQGDYRFTVLRSGDYTVCVGAFGSSTSNGRCWRDAPWDPDTATGPPADATPIDLAAGDSVTGVDVSVPQS